MPLSAKKTPRRANRTRAEILAAAEFFFASRGFSATRLEDIADEIGLTRAALFYHFRDKQTLYDAMIEDAFSPLARELHDLLDRDDYSIPQRIEKAVEAWVDAIIARPSLARLILRFVADDTEHSAVQKIFSGDELLPLKFFSLYEEGCKTGVLNPLHEDPFHVASAAIGTTVFYVGALSTLIPNRVFEPLAPEQLRIHKEEALHSSRRLLGIDSGNR